MHHATHRVLGEIVQAPPCAGRLVVAGVRRDQRLSFSRIRVVDHHEVRPRLVITTKFDVDDSQRCQMTNFKHQNHGKTNKDILDRYESDWDSKKADLN